jgi:hypothetical protein
VPLVNTEIIEMMRFAHLLQSAPLDSAMALNHAHRAGVDYEEPRRFAVGKLGASSSNRSSSALGQETPALEQLGSSVLDWAFSCVDRVAVCPGDRQAGYSHCQASEGISNVLDLEGPAGSDRSAGGLSGHSRADPPHQRRKSRLGTRPFALAAGLCRARDRQHGHEAPEMFSRKVRQVCEGGFRLRPAGTCSHWSRRRRSGSTFAMAKRGEAETHIKLLSLTGGSDREIMLKSWPTIVGLDWSADGKELYCGFTSAKGGTLVYVDLTEPRTCYGARPKSAQMHCGRHSFAGRSLSCDLGRCE